MDRPVDYDKARCAAFREFADGARGPLSGAGVLMMLYATVYGVEQNLDLSIRLAMSEVLPVFVEPEAYESSLRSIIANSGAGEFDVCDFSSGGMLFGMCMSMWRSRAQSEWRLQMEPLIDEGRACEKADGGVHRIPDRKRNRTQRNGRTLREAESRREFPERPFTQRRSNCSRRVTSQRTRRISFARRTAT